MWSGHSVTGCGGTSEVRRMTSDCHRARRLRSRSDRTTSELDVRQRARVGGTGGIHHGFREREIRLRDLRIRVLPHDLLAVVAAEVAGTVAV